MTGPKLNEKSTRVGERSGTKATARYVRMSSSKARAVLDLIRGLDVNSADQVLQLTDRHSAIAVRKVLASAVANAVNNDGEDADELYVVACFADEGPTLRRFKPRARGRATRINKRTTHITVIVARMSDEQLELLAARAERAGARGGRPTSTSRRDRVARSRAKDAAADADTTGADADELTDAVEHDAVEETEAAAADDAVESDGADSPFAGAVEAVEGEDAPEGYDIKANAQSMLYHTPDSRYYKATKAEYWFDSEESAEAAGFSKPGATTTEAADAEDAAEAADDAADEAEEN